MNIRYVSERDTEEGKKGKKDVEKKGEKKISPFWISFDMANTAASIALHAVVFPSLDAVCLEEIRTQEKNPMGDMIAK